MAVLATKKPANKIAMPSMRVTANAVSSPRRPDNVPLAANVVAPSAMSALPMASFGADVTCRSTVEDSAGFAPRMTRQTDQMAPPKMMSAGSDEPTAARIRGRDVKRSLPFGISVGLMASFIGVVRMMPVENPLKTRRHWETTRPVRWPARR